MSCCAVVQNKNAVIFATDTAVSKEIDGVKKRIGYYEKSFKIAENKCVFVSGRVDDALYVKKYLFELNQVDAEKIALELKTFKVTGRIKDDIIVVIVGLQEVVCISSFKDFEVERTVASDNSNDLNLLTFSACADEVYNRLSKYLSELNQVSNEEVVRSLIKSFNDIVCENVGGKLDVWYIPRNYNGIDHKQIQLNDNIPIFNEGHLNLENMIVRGKISFDNLPSGIAKTEDILSADTIGNIASTTITNTLVSSPTIRGGIIEGALLRSIGSDKNAVEVLDENKHMAGFIKYETNRQINENTSANTLYICTEPTYAMKLHSADNMSLSTETGKKIYMGDTVFMGTVTDKNGNAIGSGGGVAVFG